MKYCQYGWIKIGWTGFEGLHHHHCIQFNLIHISKGTRTKKITKNIENSSKQFINNKYQHHFSSVFEPCYHTFLSYKYENFY